MSATIIIPFHRNLNQLALSLPAARQSLPDAEILVAADGAVEDPGPGALPGNRLRLDPDFRATHLKRWTLWSSIVTDIRARGIPWTQLIHRHGALANDLNIKVTQRLSVVLSFVMLAAVLAAPVWPMAALVAVAHLAARAGIRVPGALPASDWNR